MAKSDRRKRYAEAPRALTQEQVEALRQQAENHRSAVNEFCEAAGVLWNSRLDMAISTKDGGLFERTLRLPPLKLWDDCNCGCGPIIVLSW